MSEFIAVHDFFMVTRFPNFKREALMFDQIALPNAIKALSRLGEMYPQAAEIFSELDWLIEQGIVIDPGISDDEELLKIPEYKEFVDYYDEHISDLDQFHGITAEDILKQSETGERHLTAKGENVWNVLGNMFGLQARQIAIQLRLLQNADAYPILSSFLPHTPEPEAKGDVIEVVLNEFPVPDEKTPWEQIKEFRDDPDSREKFFALKNWMNEVARLGLPRNEVEDKLRACMADYVGHMKFHRMKTRQETLKTLLYSEGFFTGAQLTGWSHLITTAGIVLSPLFTIAQHRIKLMEAERNAPSREVAYIIESQKTFN
jgi:hypothetical protein